MAVDVCASLFYLAYQKVLRHLKLGKGILIGGDPVHGAGSRESQDWEGL